MSDTSPRNRAGSRTPGVRHRELRFGRLDVSAAALYAAESSTLEESDFALALGSRVEELESRVGRLERGTLTRVRGVVRRGLRS